MDDQSKTTVDEAIRVVQRDAANLAHILDMQGLCALLAHVLYRQSVLALMVERLYSLDESGIFRDEHESGRFLDELDFTEDQIFSIIFAGKAEVEHVELGSSDSSTELVGHELSGGLDPSSR